MPKRYEAVVGLERSAFPSSISLVEKDWKVSGFGRLISMNFCMEREGDIDTKVDDITKLTVLLEFLAEIGDQVAEYPKLHLQNSLYCQIM